VCTRSTRRGWRMGWRRQRVLVRCRPVLQSETESVSQTSQHLPTRYNYKIQSRDRMQTHGPDDSIDGACGPHGPETSLPFYIQVDRAPGAGMAAQPLQLPIGRGLQVLISRSTHSESHDLTSLRLGLATRWQFRALQRAGLLKVQLESQVLSSEWDNSAIRAHQSAAEMGWCSR
jgi:hypothetical protein